MPATTRTPDLDDATLSRIEAIIAEQVERHEALLTAIAEHRAALTGADTARLGKTLDACADILERIAALEDERRALLGEGEHEARRTTIAEVAAGLDAPRRDRLTEMGARLKTLIERVRTEQAALGRAAESLASHMEGLIRQVAARLSNTGAYGRDGRVGEGAAVASALDVKQ